MLAITPHIPLPKELKFVLPTASINISLLTERSTFRTSGGEAAIQTSPLLAHATVKTHGDLPPRLA